MQNSIELDLRDIPADCVEEIERMVMDGGAVHICRIGKLHFEATVDPGKAVEKFLRKRGIGFSFVMRAGSFRVSDPAETCPIEAVATTAKSMGWFVEESIFDFKAREVTLRAVYGHANIPDLITALDTGLRVYKLRVTSAEPKINILNDGLVEETMTLRFGW